MSRRGDDAPNAGAGEGGEISMSIEETNKLRASLGLAPLKAENDKSKDEGEEHKKRKREEEDAAKAEALEERVRQAKERRRQQDMLSNTKTLGEAEDDVDDVMAWVNKSRTITEQQKSQKRQPKAKTAAGAGTTDGDGDNALAGAKVKHGFEDLEEGEEMILTLEDQPILDDKGRLVEEDDIALENVLARELKERSKAYRESSKTAKPLWEEDGMKRSILDKYDQEEEEALHLDNTGAFEASKIKRQEDVRSKLAAAAAAAAAGTSFVAAEYTAAGGANGGGGDYYTPEEIAAMKKPKKKKERKLKKKALTADELAALEAEAAEKGGDGDLGSRADRERRAAQKSADREAEQAAKRARFDAALNKANYASLALRPGSDAGGSDNGDDEEQDEDLYRSLKKARELAKRKQEGAPPPETIAEQLARRREAANADGGPVEGDGGGLTFTDIGEFTRTIAVNEAAADAAAEAEAAAVMVSDEIMPHAASAAATTAMEMEHEHGNGVEAMEEDGAAARVAPAKTGGWVTASSIEDITGAEGSEAAGGSRKRNARKWREEMQDDDEHEGEEKLPNGGGIAAGVTGEQSIGSGLAGALAFLKERGDLHKPVEWSGRTNDSRDSYFTAAMGGYKDVYSGGRSEDKLALDVEVALTRKDEFGRILTPKEAFRQLCHSFHGIKPSLNTREKRAKQVAKELAQRRTATGDAEGEIMAGLKAVQSQAATPYMVLSGVVKPGQSRDAASGYATVDRAEALKQQGGAAGPGMKKAGGSSSMAPPPPKPKRG